MADEPVSEQPERRTLRRSMRSIEAAAVAGLLHSVLSLVATFILLDVPDPSDGDQAIREWYLDDGHQRRLLLAVNLLTVSSIMFVWFVAVIRRRVGDRENRFFGTVFFGSALLLTGAWLVAGALFAAPAIAAQRFDLVPDAATVGLTQAGGITMATVVATRLEAVFIISTTTVGRLSGAFVPWIVAVGYAVGLTLLLMPVPSVALTWVFPIWVAAMSAMLLIRRDEIKEAMKR